MAKDSTDEDYLEEESSSPDEEDEEMSPGGVGEGVSNSMSPHDIESEDTARLAGEDIPGPIANLWNLEDKVLREFDENNLEEKEKGIFYLKLYTFYKF
jgi:hypothetical protein